MPILYFFIVLDSIEYQFLGISMIMHIYHVLIISCVFYTLCPMSAYPCISQAHLMHTLYHLTCFAFTLPFSCKNISTLLQPYYEDHDSQGNPSSKRWNSLASSRTNFLALSPKDQGSFIYQKGKEESF